MRRLTTITFFMLLTACSLAPTYHRPDMRIPSTYKENGSWLYATPQTANRARGPWWEMYADPELNRLEQQVESANQNLKAAIARYDEACAAASIARADYFPTINGVGNMNRAKTSANVANPQNVQVASDKTLAINATYELDVWGRVRNSVAAAKSVARASAADLAVIHLSLQAELANDYFSLRGDDASQRVLNETVTAYQKALYLTQQRYRGGIVSAGVVDQATHQLESAKTQAADMRLKRSQLEHAIAILIGQPPAAFHLPAAMPKAKIVTMAPALPSTLLERRPDIAEAEQFVQAANANIGVARVAFYPSFNLAGGIGLESASLSHLFQGPSLIWALGPSVASAFLNPGSLPLVMQTLFDGGRIRGLSDQAQAKYVETVAHYRQTVLTAYQEVEDNLVAIRELDHERKSQNLASQAADRSLMQAWYQYQGGLTTYLDVVVIQNIALQARLSDIQVNTQRQMASVALIKALGGGWRGGGV